jgi:hypothetical protein
LKKFTPAEEAKIIADYFDENKIILLCSKHGDRVNRKLPPVPRCQECATIYFRIWAAKKPPHERTAALEAMLESVRHLIAHESELAEIKLNQHPEVTIEKGAA